MLLVCSDIIKMSVHQPSLSESFFYHLSSFCSFNIQCILPFIISDNYTILYVNSFFQIIFVYFLTEKMEYISFCTCITPLQFFINRINKYILISSPNGSSIVMNELSRELWTSLHTQTSDHEISAWILAVSIFNHLIFLVQRTDSPIRSNQPSCIL